MKIWIFAGPRELQIQHRTKSDARTARMAEATINWNADDRSDARTQIADHQQSRLGKSVSLSSIRKPFFFSRNPWVSFLEKSFQLTGMIHDRRQVLWLTVSEKPTKIGLSQKFLFFFIKYIGKSNGLTQTS